MATSNIPGDKLPLERHDRNRLGGPMAWVVWIIATLFVIYLFNIQTMFTPFIVAAVVALIFVFIQKETAPKA